MSFRRDFAGYGCILTILTCGHLEFAKEAKELLMEKADVPVATQWVLDAAGPTQRNAVKSVFMLLCPKTNEKGTGFLLKSGLVLTAEHVIKNCSAHEIRGFDAAGQEVTFTKLVGDAKRDLAVLLPTLTLTGGLELGPDQDPPIGTGVSTWGFPLGYNGPAPLLSVGYLSGYRNVGDSKHPVKHLVVNGAFNPGNSGGPLFKVGDDKVVGVVVSKHAPLTPFVLSAIQALANNPSGILFSATDGQGNTKEFVESQIVAEILLYFRLLTQVMIGEAVAVSEVRAFLNEAQHRLK